MLVLEADVVADLAGGPGAGLGQEQSAVQANANLVDSLSVPGGRGAGGGLPLRQPHQTDPTSVQGDLARKERRRSEGTTGEIRKKEKEKEGGGLETSDLQV